MRPPPPATPTYTAQAVPPVTVASDGPAGVPQYFLQGQDLPAGWWHWFGSPQIVDLVERGFANSPTLAAARARLRGAEAQLRAQRGLLLPEVGGTGSFSYGGGGAQGARQRADSGGGTGGAGVPAPGDPGDGSGGDPGSDPVGGGSGGGGDAFTIYTVGASITYDLDLAGRNRRLVEAAAADYDQQAQELQAAYLALVGNIVSAALDAASLSAQIDTREELLAAQAERLDLLRIRVAEGEDARADLVTQEADLAALRATVPPLRAQQAAAQNRLALLIGVPPAEAAIPTIALDDINLPQAVPISLPSSLVRRRPDILAAEAVLAGASAEIGVATADLYPNLTLDGAFGLAGGASGLALVAPDPVFDLNANLLAPLFDGGRRRATRDVAVAVYQEALALYREQVLTAFTEVADGIRALESNADAVAQQRIALEAAGESLELAQFRLDEGAISIIDVLIVQQVYQDARFAYIQAIADRFQSTAALFAALGPGPLTQEQVAGITAREYLDGTRATLMEGRVPEEGL
ncbi:efflux transporter outer membrane subunit [Croceibacterium ferulae]|uniref:efflux transporter outer membrane subunit n=1 Tax=Croceibacterium ferulae TaxID=1854641 RepID=UPI0013904B1A|nr:efflux transporter outer membrane subunit [Croceibacterium ferulae]